MNGIGIHILNSKRPDDFGNFYVPFVQTMLGMIGKFVWPAWLAVRDYYFRGEA